MGNRVKGLYVSLNKDYRVEYVESLVTAIQMLKGVCEVSVSEVDANDYFNRSRIINEIRGNIYQAINDVLDIEK